MVGMSNHMDNGVRSRRTVRLIRIRHIKLPGAVGRRVVIKSAATALYIPNPGGDTRGQMEEEDIV